MDVRFFLDINVDFIGKLLNNNDILIFRYYYDIMIIINNKIWFLDIKERLN